MPLSDYITLPQTRQGKCHVLTVVEATTVLLEYVPCPTALPKALSWALASKSYGDTAPQKERSPAMRLASETAS